MVNSLPHPTASIHGYNAKEFAANITAAMIATEGYAEITAWNMIVKATGTTPPNQHNIVAHSDIKLNPDGTIPVTEDNIFKRTKMIIRDFDHYRYTTFFGSGGMHYLAHRAKPGDIIQLPGYDQNRVMEFGFSPIKVDGMLDAFIKN